MAILARIKAHIDTGKTRHGSNGHIPALTSLLNEITKFKVIHKNFRATVLVPQKELAKVGESWNQVCVALDKVSKFDADNWGGGLTDRDMNEIHAWAAKTRAKIKDYVKCFQAAVDVVNEVEKGGSSL